MPAPCWRCRERTAMRIKFEYASSSTSIQTWIWGLLVVSLLAVGAASWEYARLQKVRDGLQLHLQQNTARSVAPAVAPLSDEVRTKLEEQASQANNVLAELGHPWTALFVQLENTWTPDIALLSIRPDAAKGRLRLSGEARHLGDALDYVRRLGVSGVLTDVVLEEHEVVESDQQRPVRFAVSARWGG